MRKHLLALDGNEQANYAFNWYLQNFYRPDDQVVIFHCSQFQLGVALPGAAVNVDSVSKQVQEAVKKADQITCSANEVLKSKGIKGYIVIKSGMKPDEAILQAADEEKVDQIFMGTRDMGTIQRVFVGSVSTSVVRNAKVPVTIVKMPH
ncbi:putative universal stress protein SERP1273 [Physella acuta]|uniref:putative universal stress protein SERP1273 n=1 Tax=Physella acuta TaxID=109671 RepID=UPI0027DB20A5|nr:putative universal stress protein SERP1273 [Physella acuta]XP_059143779.1 putative universal stress protein SERP1273 [Physella acuta]XP_059143780.1 putative universal stress protein SERP1273 [Physella acuta]